MTANIMAVAAVVWAIGAIWFAAGGQRGFVSGMVCVMSYATVVICAVIHLASHLAWVR